MLQDAIPASLHERRKEMGIMGDSMLPLDRFLHDLMIVKNRAVRTVEQYEIDLTMFLKYTYAKRNGMATEGESFDSLSVTFADENFIRSITRRDIIEFLTFTARERDNHARTRARKLTSIRMFFKFLLKSKVIPENPAADIDTPKTGKQLPKFLSLEESRQLLDAVRDDRESKNRIRDYAIITLFLNCGMRLSELVSINLSDMDPKMQYLRVVGKGSKERIVYLNDACRDALQVYLPERDPQHQAKPGDGNALFLSAQHQRISIKTVQWMVYKYLKAAGLEYKHCSVHKLRHTAATLMYRTGKVDIRVLKDILGHEQLNTTQIYTHISDEDMQKAVSLNPLAEEKGIPRTDYRVKNEEPDEPEKIMATGKEKHKNDT